jgi:hypothetical protein
MEIDPMKCGARVALGVVGGYFLGRTKKMKLALMLGGMAAGRGAGGPGQLVAQGSKLLKQSPELAKLTDEVRGRLLEAGKGAALAVATRQVESLTDRVGRRVGAVADGAGSVGRKARAAATDDEYGEDAYDDVDDSPAERDEGNASKPADDELARRSSRRRPSSPGSRTGTTAKRATSSTASRARRTTSKTTGGGRRSGQTTSARRSSSND